jgi:acetolactate decarboxylase
MISRRGVLRAGFGLCACAACQTIALSSSARTTGAEQPTRVQGSGYELYYVGAQRDTVMNGRPTAAIDLRSLAKRPNLYGIGPIEELRGEVTIIDSRPSLARMRSDGNVQVTENYDTGAPFLVWAEVPAWRTIPIPTGVRSFTDIETFVPRAAATLGLAPQLPLPFLIHGREQLVEFHILNRIGNQPHNAEQHKKIQIRFELKLAEVIIVGFHSTSHHGVFTAMDSSIHMHFQTPNNIMSGHIQMLELGSNTSLSLPLRHSD